MPGLDVTPKKRSIDEENNSPPLPSLLRHKKKQQLVGESPTTTTPSHHREHHHVDGNNSVVTVSDIVERARRIFRQHDEQLDVTQLPCLSARLFACFTLEADIRLQHQPTTSYNAGGDRGGTTTPLCSTRFEQAIRHVRPILPFLSALVRVELMSLRQDETLNKLQQKKGNHHHQQQQHQQQPSKNHHLLLPGEPLNAPPRVRKVEFSGFDCSSTQPPSDTRLGSHVHRERCTDALLEAMEQARALQTKLATKLSLLLPPQCSTSSSSGGVEGMPPPPSPMVVTQDDDDDNDDNNDRVDGNDKRINTHNTNEERKQKQQANPSATATDTTGATAAAVASDAERLQIEECLQAMIHFFQDLIKTPKSPFVTVSAQSIHSSYPSARVIKAIDLYRRELSTLLQSSSTTLSTSTSSLLPRSQVLFVHHKLVSFLAQDIRYQLRILFNPAPYNAVDKAVDLRHSKRSLVPQLVQLYSSVNFVKGKKKKKEPAIDENSVISCVVSNALQRLYDFFGRDVSLHLEQSYATSTVPSPPTGFCQSPASLRGLVDPIECKRKGRLSISSTSSTSSASQDDLQMVLLDVKQAFLYLSATRAARFLLDLLKADGVDEAIHAVGGWSTIEHHAQLLCQYASYCCPEDEHFVLLAHVPLLVQVLEDIFHNQDATVALCQQALQDVYRRFKCADTGRIRKRFPQIAKLANAYEDMTILSQFPLVHSTTSDAPPTVSNTTATITTSKASIK